MKMEQMNQTTLIYQSMIYLFGFIITVFVILYLELVKHLLELIFHMKDPRS